MLLQAMQRKELNFNPGLALANRAFRNRARGCIEKIPILAFDLCIGIGLNAHTAQFSFLGFKFPLPVLFHIDTDKMSASKNKTYTIVYVHHPGVFASFSTAYHRNVYCLRSRCFRSLLAALTFGFFSPHGLAHLPYFACASLAKINGDDATQTTTFVLGETSGFICVFVARN